MNNDTIAAISTPPGDGGLGIVRISGPEAARIGHDLFRLPGGRALEEMESHRLYYGYVVDRDDGRRLDEVLISFMAAPRSYTREDVLEISCHGGLLPVREVLRQALLAGARPAEPGEFTKRAFLSGRLDLAQAEAVVNIIRSRSDAGLKNAVAQLRGGLSRETSELRGEVVALLAGLEAEMDFVDELEQGPFPGGLPDALRRLLERAERLAASASKGRILQEGAVLAIIGRPNVGKSSLLNALLQEARAIVTEVPGTTRDAIEVPHSIRGLPVRAIDTAGIRDTRDPVERIGVERAREVLAAADLVLMVVDGSCPQQEADLALAAETADKRRILVINKADLPAAAPHEDLEGLTAPAPCRRISAVTGEGLPELEEEIAALLLGTPGAEESVMMAGMRHLALMLRAAASLRSGLEALAAKAPPEIIAVDLRQAIDALGEITGETTTEDVINRIFSDFCIGK